MKAQYHVLTNTVQIKVRTECSHSSSCLSLHYSSSPFEGHSSSSGDDNEEGSQRSVVLYLYESEQESGSEAESGTSSGDNNRLEEWLLNS